MKGNRIYPILILILTFCFAVSVSAKTTVTTDSKQLTITFDGGWEVVYGKNPETGINALLSVQTDKGDHLVREGGMTGAVVDFWLNENGSMINGGRIDEILSHEVTEDGRVSIKYRKSGGDISTIWFVNIKFDHVDIADHRYARIRFDQSVLLPHGVKINSGFARNSLWQMAVLALNDSLDGMSLFVSKSGRSSVPMGVYHLQDEQALIDGPFLIGIPGIRTQPFILIKKGQDKTLLLHPNYLYHPDFSSLTENDHRGSNPHWSVSQLGNCLQVSMSSDMSGVGGEECRTSGFSLLYSDEPYDYPAQAYLDIYRFISDYFNEITGTRWNPYIAELVPEDVSEVAHRGGLRAIIPFGAEKRWGEFGYGHAFLDIWRNAIYARLEIIAENGDGVDLSRGALISDVNEKVKGAWRLTSDAHISKEDGRGLGIAFWDRSASHDRTEKGLRATVLSYYRSLPVDMSVEEGVYLAPLVDEQIPFGGEPAFLDVASDLVMNHRLRISAPFHIAFLPYDSRIDPEWLMPVNPEGRVPVPLRLGFGYGGRSGPYEYLMSRWLYYSRLNALHGAVLTDDKFIGYCDLTDKNAPVSNLPYVISLIAELQKNGFFFYGAEGRGLQWADLNSAMETEWRAVFRTGSGLLPLEVPNAGLSQYNHTGSPRVLRFIPGDGAIDVSPGTPMSLLFDVPIEKKQFVFRVTVNGVPLDDGEIKTKWSNGNRLVELEHPSFPQNSFVVLYLIRARADESKEVLEGIEFLGAYRFGWRSKPDEQFLYHRHKYGGRPYRSDVACSLTNINNRMMQVGFAGRFGFPPDRILLLGNGATTWVIGEKSAPYPTLSPETLRR